MKSAVITSGEHWLTIDGIDYLRGTIETIERLTYVQGEQEAVKISGSSVNASVILVDETTIDGVEVTSQDELVDFIKQYSFREGGGDGSGVTHENIQQVLDNGDVVEKSLTIKNPNGDSVLDLEGYHWEVSDNVSGNGYVRIRNGWINITAERFLDQITTLANVNSKGFRHFQAGGDPSVTRFTELHFDDDNRLRYHVNKPVDGTQQDVEYLFPETNGNDREVVVWDDEGNMKAERLGWKQFSDMPTPPTFSNGVLTGTAFQEDGSALYAFIQLAVDQAVANSIPLYSNRATVRTANATQPDDAINLGQINGLFLIDIIQSATTEQRQLMLNLLNEQ